MYMFHKEGIKIIAIATIIFIIGTLFIYLYIPLVYCIILILLLFGLYFFILYFFRNPKRYTLSKKGDIIAPVDGKIVAIKETLETEHLKENRIQISIFMSPLNVHVCRYPLSGKVVYTKYHPGKFLVAWHPKSSILNERTTVAVKQGKKKVLFRQIAGIVARRIVLYAKKGHEIVAGEEFGFIKFGSRVDIFLPLNTEIKVVLNQKVKGGITHIAKFKN